MSPKKYDKAKPHSRIKNDTRVGTLKPILQLSFSTLGIMERNRPKITENVAV